MLKQDRARQKQERDCERAQYESKLAGLQAQTELGFAPENCLGSGPQFRVDAAAKLLPKLVSEQ